MTDETLLNDWNFYETATLDRWLTLYVNSFSAARSFGHIDTVKIYHAPDGYYMDVEDTVDSIDIGIGHMLYTETHREFLGTSRRKIYKALRRQERHWRQQKRGMGRVARPYNRSGSKVWAGGVWYIGAHALENAHKR